MTDEVVDSVLATTFMVNREQLAGFIRARLGGRDGVEDLMQELWLKARQIDQDVERPLSYLYRMAHRLVLDGHRGASRSRERENDWGYVNGRLGEGSEPAYAERSMIARERLRSVEAVLEAVGARAALIFRRYRIDGIAQDRIAAELGVSISTVEKDLRKIYDALSVLQDRGNEE